LGFYVWKFIEKQNTFSKKTPKLLGNRRFSVEKFVGNVDNFSLAPPVEKSGRTKICHPLPPQWGRKMIVQSYKFDDFDKFF